MTLAELRGQALTRKVPPSRLAGFVLKEFVRQMSEQKQVTPAIIQHLRQLVAMLELQVNAIEFGKIAEAMTPSKQELMVSKTLETQERRLELHETVNAILRDVLKLCESEEAAANARARMEAMRLANTTIRTDLAVLGGFDKRDIDPFLVEAKEAIEQLRTQLETDHTRG